MISTLTTRERDFLAAVSAGQTAAAFSRENGYTADWGKWMSRTIRAKLGVDTLQEAIRLSEDGVSRSDFDKLAKLVESTNEAVAALAAAAPHEREGAKQEVVTREMDEREMAKKLGISLDDLKKIRDENEYAKFKTMQERLDAEKAAALEAEQDDDEEAEEEQPKRDGLGGIRNLVR